MRKRIATLQIVVSEGWGLADIFAEITGSAAAEPASLTKAREIYEARKKKGTSLSLEIVFSL